MLTAFLFLDHPPTLYIHVIQKLDDNSDAISLRNCQKFMLFMPEIYVDNVVSRSNGSAYNKSLTLTMFFFISM